MAHYLFVIAGPSAVGKTYLANLLISHYSDKFESVKIFTTRKPRSSELVADRIFVSNDEFDKQLSAGEFPIHGEFQGNRYGYASESLKPSGKHLIVNAWPSYVPRFLDHKNVVFIGLGTQNYDLLKKRMQERGDSPKIIRERMVFIDRDIADLASVQQVIKHHGKLFEVKDDSTIPDVVIPWIISQS